MMNSFMPQGARYGVLGENINGTDASDVAFGMAKNINDLFQQKYQQQANQQALQGTNMDLQKQRMMLANLPQQQDVANQMAQQGLEKGQLGLKTDQFNFNRLPQTSALSDQEAQAKIALQNAQANQANGKDLLNDPVAKFKRIYFQYQNADADSPQKMFYGTLLDSMMGGAAGATGVMGGSKPSTGTGTATGGASSKVGPNGEIINPYSVSQKSMRGASSTAQNPDGTVTTYEGPTTANSTANQSRLQAHQEIQGWYDRLQNGISPYQGDWGSGNGKLILDNILAHGGNQDAMNRLKEFALAQMIKPEVAGVSGRMTSNGGPVGVEMVKQFENSQNLGTPTNLISRNALPPEALNWASKEYPGVLKKGVEAAAEFARQNNPVGLDSAPEYAQQTPPKLGSFTRGAMSPEKLAAYDAQNQDRASNSPSHKPVVLPNNVTPSELQRIANKRGISVEEAHRQAIEYWRSKNV